MNAAAPDAQGNEPSDAEAGATADGIVSADNSMFASLKNRDYALLWTGQAGSAFAMNMQLVAQGWLVYEMTVSTINLALVTFAFTAPQIFFSLIGGVLADRVRKKPLLLWSQALNGVATLVMAVIILTGQVTFFDFIWVGFLNGTVLALSMPARTAFIPEIVGEGLMFNAMAFNMASWNVARHPWPGNGGADDRRVRRRRQDQRLRRRPRLSGAVGAIPRLVGDGALHPPSRPSHRDEPRQPRCATCGRG